MRECKDPIQNDNDKHWLAKHAQTNSVWYAIFITLSDIDAIQHMCSNTGLKNQIFSETGHISSHLDSAFSAEGEDWTKYGLDSLHVWNRLNLHMHTLFRASHSLKIAHHLVCLNSSKSHLNHSGPMWRIQMGLQQGTAFHFVCYVPGNNGLS